MDARHARETHKRLRALRFCLRKLSETDDNRTDVHERRMIDVVSANMHEWCDTVNDKTGARAARLRDTL